MSWILRSLCAAALIVGFGFAAARTTAADAAAKPELKCPVSDKPADGSISTKLHGKSISLCCPGCEAALQKNATKYAVGVTKQLLLTKQAVQVACPLSGGKLDAEENVTVDGVKVAFCCGKCKAKVEAAAADADKATMLFGAESKGFSLQTECPVSGKAIDAAHSVEHKGKKVYFCCPNCPKAFSADPAKFEAKLESAAK